MSDFANKTLSGLTLIVTFVHVSMVNLTEDKLFHYDEVYFTLFVQYIILHYSCYFTNWLVKLRKGTCHYVHYDLATCIWSELYHGQWSLKYYEADG